MNNPSNGTASKLSLLKGAKPRETEHTVVLDNRAIESYAKARADLEAAQDTLRLAQRRMEDDGVLAGHQAAVKAAQSRVDELEPAAEEGAGIVTVTLRAMPPLAYAALRAEFPATDTDHARVRADTGNDNAKAAWNEAEFAPRLIAHSLVDPRVEVDDARGFQEAWAAPDWNLLVRACMRLNEDVIDTESLVFSSGRTRS